MRTAGFSRHLGIRDKNGVFFVGRAIGRRHNLENPTANQIAQPGCQDPFGEAETFLKFAEPARTVEGIADN